VSRLLNAKLISKTLNLSDFGEKRYFELALLCVGVKSSRVALLAFVVFRIHDMAKTQTQLSTQRSPGLAHKEEVKGDKK
jgi:hypothetical protein